MTMAGNDFVDKQQTSAPTQPAPNYCTSAPPHLAPNCASGFDAFCIQPM
jgi:hypothetical protein